MSKKPFILLLAAVVCIVAVSFAVVPFKGTDTSSGAEITGKPADNDYNNYLSGGELVRLGDRLYYNYDKNGFSYGLFEITKSGSKRIYWNGIYLFGYLDLIAPIRALDGRLSVNVDEAFRTYSHKSGEMQRDTFFDMMPDMNWDFQRSGGKIYYTVRTDDPDTDGSLWVYDGTASAMIIKADIDSFYVAGDSIFYLESNNNGDSIERIIKRYDALSASTQTIIELQDYSVWDFFVEGDYIVFEGNTYEENAQICVYKIDLRKPKMTLETVYEGSPDVPDYVYDIKNLNVYGGRAFVASHSGLKSFDLETNRAFTLCDRYVEACYIVDEKWVYFVDEKSTLYRVTQDGKTLEKVFG